MRYGGKNSPAALATPSTRQRGQKPEETSENPQTSGVSRPVSSGPNSVSGLRPAARGWFS